MNPESKSWAFPGWKKMPFNPKLDIWMSLRSLVVVWRKRKFIWEAQRAQESLICAQISLDLGSGFCPQQQEYLNYANFKPNRLISSGPWLCNRFLIKQERFLLAFSSPDVSQQLHKPTLSILPCPELALLCSFRVSAAPAVPALPCPSWGAEEAEKKRGRNSTELFPAGRAALDESAMILFVLSQHSAE